MRNFKEYLERKKKEYGNKFDPSDLDPKFISAYESGERIRVKLWRQPGGLTGTVGITTGWKPVFLLMMSANAIGSSVTLKADNSEFTHEKRAYHKREKAVA